MKKIITWIASFILASSTAPAISQLVLNTSFSKNSINNNYSYKNDSYWPIYNNLQHKGNFTKFNDSLGVFNDKEYQKTYFVNKDGQFTELKLNGDSVVGTFSQFNDNQGVFITATASYFLSNSGAFTEVKVKGNFVKFNDSLGVFNDKEYQKTYFVNKDGQFTELKLNGNSVVGTFSQFNDNQGVFITATASYFLSNSGAFTELKVKGISDSPISITGTAKRMNKNTCVYTSDQGWNFFLDVNGNFSRIYTDGSTTDRKCTFYPWTHEMGLLIFPMPSNQYDKIFILKENEIFVTLNDQIEFQFALHFHVTNFGVLNNDYCLLRSNYDWYGDHDNSFILQTNKSYKKLENNFNNFVKFTDEIGVFSSSNNEAFSFEIATNEKVNTFEQKINNGFSTSGVIKDVDNSNFKGKVANADVNFDLTSKYLTEVKIDGQVQPIADKKINIKIISEGKHEIFIKNKLTSDLTYDIYIKKQPIKDKIIDITGHQLTNYVGVDNKGKLIDVLQSNNQVTFDFNNWSDKTFIKNNKLNTIKNDFDITNTVDIQNDKQYFETNNYLVQTEDLVGNKWSTYLTIGTPDWLIPNYWNTTIGNQTFNEALHHGYSDNDLQQMNAIGVESIVKQYNARSWNKPNNLDTISIDDLNLFLNFDKNKKYKDLTSEILNQVNNSKNSKFIDSPLIDANFKFLENGKDIANEFESEQNLNFDLIISVPNGKPNWFGQTNPLSLTLHTAPKPPIPPTPIKPNNELSSWNWALIIIASIITFGGIWLITQFQLIPKIKLKKMIKKHNKEIKEFETRKTEKENKND